MAVVTGASGVLGEAIVDRPAAVTAWPRPADGRP